MITFKFQWKLDGSNIINETNPFYTVKAGDVGKSISCEVTATNSYGNTVVETMSVTPNSKPVNTVIPAISGTLTVIGSTLSTSNGTWTAYPTPTYTYQWKRNGTNVAGRTANTYVTSNTDIDANVSVTVTATNSSGSNNATSANVTIRSAPLRSVNNVISGANTVGSTLTTTQGTWLGSPTITYAYQWKRNGSNITGSTSTTYTIVTADIDASITCVVTATSTYGSNTSTSNAIVGAQAPINTVLPLVSGTPTVGQSLTVSSGTWTGSATITYAYQWKRNGSNISAATSSTYTVVSADLGTAITCTVTATNTRGSTSATSTNSMVGQQAPQRVANNTISSGAGATFVGSTVSSTTGTWTGYPTPTYTYQWKRDGSNISGATNSGYVGQTADIDLELTCQVTATNSVGTNNSVSNIISVRAIPVNTVAPSISGTPSVGSTLTTSTGTWTGSETLTLSYQWKRNGSNISGATSSTYVVQTADIDTSITCTVTGTNPFGTSSVTTAGTTAWQAPVNGVAPVISGSTIVGALLTATTGTWTGSATITFAYQWKRDGSNISAATSSTYTTVGADVGTSITCTVTATNARGSASSTSNGLSITSSMSINNQSFDFGALTKAGNGAVRMIPSSGIISSASITGGNGLGHWSIASDGTITPNTAGDTANLNSGPYQLLCSFNGGAATANAIITIIANSYSVVSNTEVEAVIGTTTNGDLGTPASLAAARTILFRTGDYVGFHDDMLKTKNWGNTLTLKPHTGAIPLIRKQLSVYASANLVFDGLTFVVEDNDNKAGISFANAFSTMSVQNCMFYANTVLAKDGTSYTSNDPYITFGVHYANGSVGTGMSVVNNNFHDVCFGIHGQSDGTHNVQGNYLYDIYSAPIRVIQSASSSATVISDNVIEGIIAKASDFNSPSPVFVALDGNTSITADWSGIKLHRNILINKYSFSTPAGIRADNMNSSYYHNAVEAFGNFIINGENANTGLEIKRAKACWVKGNTIVSPNFASGSSAPGVLVGGTASSGTHVIENNAYDSITSYGTTTLTNNVVLGAKGATVSYASAFVGPTFTVNNKADVLSKFAMKTSGPLDLATNVGAVGSGYVSWPSNSPGNNGSFASSIPNQTIEFGALTRGGMGACTISSGIVTITSASITGGTGSAWFDISSSGAITKKAANNTTLPAGPLTLTLSINGGAYSPTITINTSGNDENGINLATAYSVADEDEFATVGELSTWAYGQTIMLRSGTYNASQDMTWGIWRSTKPSGTFTPPTYISVSAGQRTGSKGYDLSTANWATITRHAGGTMPVIKRMKFNNNNGNDQNTNIYGIRITNLEFHRTNTPGVAIVNGAGTSVVGTNSLNETTATLSFTNGASWVCVDHCYIHGTEGAGVTWDLIDTHSGIYGGKYDFLIYDNEFSDVLYGVGNMNALPNGFHAIGNKFFRIWFDCLSVRPADNIKINFNTFWDKRSPYMMVGGGIHPDLVQINHETTFLPSLLNGQFIGNVGWRGLGSEVMEAGSYDGTDFQGLILASTPYGGSTAIATNWYVEGNMFINTGEYNKMIMSLKDSFVRWNTTATHEAPEYDGTIADGWMRLNPESTNNTIQYNVVERVLLDSPADTTQLVNANNTLVNRYVANNVANSYALNFSGAHTIQGQTIVYPDTPLTYYAINTSSVAYTSSPRHGAAGTGYVNYTTRTTTFPV